MPFEFDQAGDLVAQLVRRVGTAGRHGGEQHVRDPVTRLERTERQESCVGRGPIVVRRETPQVATEIDDQLVITEDLDLSRPHPAEHRGRSAFGEHGVAVGSDVGVVVLPIDASQPVAGGAVEQHAPPRRPADQSDVQSAGACEFLHVEAEVIAVPRGEGDFQPRPVRFVGSQERPVFPFPGAGDRVRLDVHQIQEGHLLVGLAHADREGQLPGDSGGMLGDHRYLVIGPCVGRARLPDEDVVGGGDPRVGRARDQFTASGRRCLGDHEGDADQAAGHHVYVGHGLDLQRVAARFVLRRVRRIVLLRHGCPVRRRGIVRPAGDRDYHQHRRGDAQEPQAAA